MMTKAANDSSINNLYIKIAVGCLLPYRDDNLLNLSEKSTSILKKIFEDKNNINLIKSSMLSISDKEGLLSFIVDFYKDKIVKEKTFLDLLSILSINYKGLSFEEINRIVI